MSILRDSTNVRIVRGNLLNSNQQTLVNTVNTVGVMGKGVALAFKRQYPEMFKDYVEKCNRGVVRLGRPYLYKAAEHLIVNFPTKGHWRSVSRLEDIVKGLEFLESHYVEWGIESLAVPPLGCGNGQLDWDVVKGVLVRHLSRLDVPVDLYAPHDTTDEQMLLPVLSEEPGEAKNLIVPAWVAWVQILAKVQSEPYHWPVGRIFGQKIAYFASVAGIPLPLSWSAGNFGPFAGGLKQAVAALQNNGLVVERENGKMIELRVGPTAADAIARHESDLTGWNQAIDRTIDLVCRFSSQDAEVAATVHYVVSVLTERHQRTPMAQEVLDSVWKWKAGRRWSVTSEQVTEAIVALASQGWIEVQPDASLDGLLADSAS